MSSGTRILGYKYAYNTLGNISQVSVGNVGSMTYTVDETYTYDKLGQLTSATDVDTGYSYSYTYDSAGNIRSMVKTKTATNAKTTKTLSYDNASWPDLLTSVTVGGTTKSITYQTAANGNLTGNPQTWYNGKDWDFTWGKGTQLTSVTKKSNDNTFTYTYDMSGVRDSKTVNGVTYSYTTLSGLVMQQDWINANGKHKTLTFLYDDNNQPYAIINNDGSTATPVLYYYLLNQQGDVMGLMNTDSTIVARYSYDPWGVPTVLNPDGTKNTTSTFIGNLNPLRYRGYFFDKETGFYYLQSRYYDPAIGRFISADSYASTGQGFLGCNMFAYCNNDPVNCKDSEGSICAEAMIVGGILNAGLYVAGAIVDAAQSGEPITVKRVLIEAAKGFAVGAFESTLSGMWRQIYAVMSVGYTFVECYTTYGDEKLALFEALIAGGAALTSYKLENCFSKTPVDKVAEAIFGANISATSNTINDVAETVSTSYRDTSYRHRSSQGRVRNTKGNSKTPTYCVEIHALGAR